MCVELWPWNLYNFVNQYHPNKFDEKEKKRVSTNLQMASHTGSSNGPNLQEHKAVHTGLSLLEQDISDRPCRAPTFEEYTS